MADPIIGRESELESLDAFLDEIPFGPVALLFEGEAGIGKTTLWKAGVASGIEKGYRLVPCQPAESEAKFSFAALGDLLDGVGDETLSRLSDPQRRALEVALLRSAGRAPDQRAVSVAVVAVLRFLSETGPLLVAVDDVQWLDPPSARVLDFAIRRLTLEPVGILGSFRTEEKNVVPLGLDRALPEARLHRLHVGPLNLGALQHLVRTRLNASLSRPVLLRIHEATGGNPFFALEMARALLQQGAGPEPGQALPIPDNLRELVHLRLASLPSRVRKVLLAVSALARPTVVLVQQISDRSDVVMRSLESAVRTGVIVIEGGRIAFAHPLLGSVVYADATDEARQGIHRRMAQLVAEPEERARHLALGADGPDAEAARTLEEAARTARSRGAPDAAAELFELAGKLTPARQARNAWGRYVDAACCYYEVGDTVRARRLLDEVVAGSPSGPDQARALLRLATVMHDCDGPLRSVPMLEKALPQAGEDLALRMEVEAELAHELEAMGDLSGARLHARAAVEVAGRLDDPAALASALTNEIDLATSGGITPEILQRATSLAESVSRSAAESGQLTTLPKYTLAVLLMVVGELDRARSLFLEEDRWVIERGVDYLREYVLWALARLECRAGNFERAARYAEESYRASFRREGTMSDLLSCRAEAAAALGEVELARAAAEGGLADAERLGVPFSTMRNRAVLGFVELSLGNLARANDYLAPAATAMQEMALGEPAYIQFLPDAIEAMIGLGELDQAEALLAPFEERGAALDRAWALATAARCRGMVQAAHGDLPAAIRTLERALQEHDRVAQPFDLARTLLVSGTIQRRARKWGAARTAIQRALDIFEDLGAPLWAEKARAELRRIGGRPPQAGGLTATEEKVAELVATGLTNQQVADTLFMSVNTVGANLSRVYHKLGVRSRTELGSKLAARRPSASIP